MSHADRIMCKKETELKTMALFKYLHPLDEMPNPLSFVVPSKTITEVNKQVREPK